MAFTLRRRRPPSGDWRLFDGDGGALLSSDQKHRLVLWRRWDRFGRMCVFMMLNPSTANAKTNDATVNKCIGFAKRWGYGGVIIVNAFTYRATDPRDLVTHLHENPQREDEEAQKVLEFVMAYTTINQSAFVCAWGATLSGVEHLSPLFMSIVVADIPLKALKITKYGHPGHPLYIPYDQPLIDFVPDQAYGSKVLAGYNSQDVPYHGYD